VYVVDEELVPDLLRKALEIYAALQEQGSRHAAAAAAAAAQGGAGGGEAASMGGGGAPAGGLRGKLAATHAALGRHYLHLLQLAAGGRYARDDTPPELCQRRRAY
jgi:hypothetical protein